MAVRYWFDLYPRTDPSAARLVRFTNLQSAEYRGEANGTGAGRFTIRATDAEAAFLDPEGLQYVRVVRDDGATELVVGGFFLDSGDYSALTETSTKLLTWGGAGTLSYLGRAVMDADSWIDDPFIGTDPQPEGVWPLHLAGTGNELGAILWRVLHEVEEPGRHQDPLPLMTLGFTHLLDSNAAAWVRTTGDFTAQVGENVISIVRRLMQMGLYVEVDPNTFEVNAYEPETHRRDRTGGSWGANVVRFQSPTDGTVATGNVKSDAKRALEAKVRRNAVLTGSKDSWLWVDDPGVTVPWEGSYLIDDDTGSSLLKAGEAQLAARSDAGDTLRLRFKLAADPTNGAYLPFEHVRLDDVVTVHTGTGQWDYNEAEFPVAALTVALRPGGDWDAWADLGSTYLSMAERAFQASQVPLTGDCNCPPNLLHPSRCEAVCVETYTRTVDPGWGNSEIDALVYSGNAIYNVNGSAGGARQLANGGPTPMNQAGNYSLPFEILIKRKLIKHVEPAVQSGNYIDVLNWVNNTGSYLDAAGVTLGWEVVSNDLSVRLNSTAGLFPLGVVLNDYTSGRWFWMRFRVTATNLYVKTWYVGDSEPAAWGATTGTAAITPDFLGWGVQTYHADADMEFRDDWYQIVEGFECEGNCPAVGTVVGTGAGFFGADTGFYLPPGSALEHGNITTAGPYHRAADVTIADAANDFTATEVEGALAELQSDAEAHLADAADAHDASAISVLDTAANFTETEVEGVLAELYDAVAAGGGDITAHLGDATDAHDASAVSFTPAGAIAATDVQAAIEEVAAEAGGGGGGLDMSTRMEISDECYFVTVGQFYHGGVFSTASGTSAASASSNSLVGHPGIIQHTTGTTATGRAALFGGTIILGGGELTFGQISIIDTLSDGTHTFIVRNGLADGFAGGDPARGVFFRYTDGVAAGNWEAVTRTGGVETATDTGITADTAYHRYEYVVNAGATSVEFFIDGASVATNTTNIPSLVVQFMPSSIQKTVGLTARTMKIDAYWYTIDPFTTPR